MTLTLARIEALAPDQASLSAGVKLAKAKAWVVLGQDAAAGLAWGECQGSGSSPYKVILGLDDGGYKCTCPSRKFPCKHALGLMLLVANADAALADGAAPGWAGDWIAKRKPRATARPVPETAGETPSLGAALAEPEAEASAPDPKALERAQRQRERLAAEREASVADGLDALDRWIADALERGLVAFAAQARAHCATIAKRLVDAKAPALAAKLDALPAEILTLPEDRRADALIEALGGFHLLAEAYRRRDALPEGLAHEVRRLVGWSFDRAALMERVDARRVASTWMVIATRVEVQPDKLRRIETWLMAVGDPAADGAADGDPRFAVLMDFVPASTTAIGSSFLVGERFEAELCFYPAATPLRAVVVTRGGGTEGAAWAVAGLPLAAALAAYAKDLAANPWLPAWPLALTGVAVRRDAAGALWIAGAGDALPTPAGDADDLLALVDGGALDMVGLWNGRHFAAMAAATPLGPWFHA